jgi:hypothetical protein
MLTALLLAALPVSSTTSSAVSAASNAGHSSVHLLSGAEIQFVDDEGPNGDFPPIEGMTREQLQREWDRLDSSRPGLGGAIGLLAGGVAVAVVGFYIAYIGLLAAIISSTSTGTSVGISPGVGMVLLVVGLVVLAGGIALAVVGGLKLRSTLHDRSRYGEQMNLIQDRLNANPGQPYYPPPPPGDQNVPPPPPPPPPSVQNLTPVQSGGVALLDF